MLVTKLRLRTKSCTLLKACLINRPELLRTVAPMPWNATRLTKPRAFCAAQILTLTLCN